MYDKPQRAIAHCRHFLQVEVTPNMEAPIVLERIHNLTTRIGEDVRFRVRYYAKPEPEVAWYRNEVKLEKSERMGWFYPEVCMKDNDLIDVKNCCCLPLLLLAMEERHKCNAGSLGKHDQN